METTLKKAVGFCLLLCLLVSCGKNKEENKVESINVKVQRIDSVASATTSTYVGVIKEKSNTPMSFQMGGTITKVFVKNGDFVRKGQVLMMVDSVNINNLYRTAKAKYEQAKDGYERAAKVYEQGGLPEIEFISIKTKLQEAENLYSSSLKENENTTLYASCDGVISECNVEEGQNVIPNQTVCSILNINELFVDFAVPENDIVKGQKGDPIQVSINALDGTYTGRVTEKDYSANAISHTYPIKAQLHNKQNLMPGMLCKVQLTKNDIMGFVIPSHCIQTGVDGLTIWVLEDGLANKRSIHTGAYSNGGILVTDGLSKGDLVVVEGIQKLYKGAQVTVIE